MRLTASLCLGYVFASAAAVFLAKIMPLPQDEAVIAATQLGYVALVAAILWCFATTRFGCTAFILLLSAMVMTVPTYLLAARP